MRDEEGVFGEYDDESRMVCSRNYGIAAEYGLLKHFLRKKEDSDCPLKRKRPRSGGTAYPDLHRETRHTVGVRQDLYCV